MQKRTAAMLALGITTLCLSTARAADAGQTPQALFNAGQAASERGDWAGAVTAFRAAIAAVSPSARSVPVMRSRLANALEHARKMPEAEQEATLSIRGFTAQGVTKDDDLSFAYLLLGNVHRDAIDTDRAIDDYQHALASGADTTSANLLPIRFGLALAALTTKPDLSASMTDAIIADTKFFAALSKSDQANIYSLRGMADLNRGQAKPASGYVEKALDLTGRTTTKVNINQVRIRGDAALIYSRLGQQENVRQYLTYSGAGHLPDSDWLSSADKDLPVCDGDVGPQDFAVVDFAIRDDGHVAGARAVYASRPGPVGDAFATAVKGWHWQPKALAKLNPFWRASIRVEVRCVKRPPLLGLTDAFRDATTDWMTQSGYDPDLIKGPYDPHAVGDAPVPAAFRALQKANGSRDVAAAVRALGAALAAANAPADVRAYALYSGAWPQNAVRGRAYAAAHARNLEAALPELAQIPGSAHGQAWFRTEIGLALELSGSLAPALAALQAVTTLPTATLAEDDPIRSLAVLHMALINKRSGASALADKQITDAGLDAEQCSLLDVRPVPRNTDLSNSTFPAEAQQWHFEGNVREAFDIAADGHVEGVRTVLSYPPFVFGPATERAVAQFRYLPPTLGTQVLGCVGQTVNVNYRLPD